jgi:hypothetical protein
VNRFAPPLQQQMVNRIALRRCSSRWNPRVNHIARSPPPPPRESHCALATTTTTTTTYTVAAGRARLREWK